MNDENTKDTENGKNADKAAGEQLDGRRAFCRIQQSRRERRTRAEDAPITLYIRGAR
jgi:hypothetical protein